MSFLGLGAQAGDTDAEAPAETTPQEDAQSQQNGPLQDDIEPTAQEPTESTPEELTAPANESVDAPIEEMQDAASEPAFQFGFSGTNTLELAHRTDNRNGRINDDNYSSFIDSLQLQGQTERTTLGLRLTGMHYLNPPPGLERPFDVRPERALLLYRGENFQAGAGDFHEQLGRGIMLSLRPRADAGLDMSIRGGKLVLETDNFKWNSFGGFTNTINRDVILDVFVADKNDILAGSQMELITPWDFTVGVMGAYLQPEEQIIDSELDLTASYGAFVDFPALGDLSLYLEAEGQSRRLVGIEQQGFAFYGVGDMLLGDFMIFMEGLHISDFEFFGSQNSATNAFFQYNFPPTLERFDQEYANVSNFTGGRIRLEYDLSDYDLTPYVNQLIKLNDPGEPASLFQTHSFAGFIYEGDPMALNLSGGFRHESQGAEPLEGDFIRSYPHFEGDFGWNFSDDYSLDLSTWNQFISLKDHYFFRGSNFFGINHRSLGGITFEYGYDTLNTSEEIQNYFFAAVIVLKYKDWLENRTTVGTQRGGIKCIAGVCRDTPAFSGVKSQFVARF
ncbi:MAG: hypothetical protein CMH56_11920 [Myxococcales bacterium]|nr:hypothetical protein [Myxococcales bacterium]